MPELTRRDLLKAALGIPASSIMSRGIEFRSKRNAVAMHSRALPDVMPVIFDTDVGNDIDDALALSLLHALESRRECRIRALTITKDNPWCAPYIDLVNTFYGRPNIPIGVVKGSGVTPENSRMIQIPSERRRPDGSLVYPHRLLSGEAAAESVGLLRRVLATESDKSVTIVQVGFSTNLARLLDSPPDKTSGLRGVELVERKVRLLSVMAGNFVSGDPEFNVKMDVTSAQKVFSDWPTEIVASGFEIGQSMLFPASSIEKDFAYVRDHPVAEAYRNYMPMPFDRPTWDLTAALFAVRPDRGYFSLSAPGEIRADSAGRTRFEQKNGGRHRHLIVSPQQQSRTLECMIQLASQPPHLA
jgi:purine nucleosidase